MPEMPFETFDVEVTLTWSRQTPNGRTPYLGDQGEEIRTLTDYALLEILRAGLRDDQGNVVTSIHIWTPIPSVDPLAFCATCGHAWAEHDPYSVGCSPDEGQCATCREQA